MEYLIVYFFIILYAGGSLLYKSYYFAIFEKPSQRMMKEQSNTVNGFRLKYECIKICYDLTSQRMLRRAFMFFLSNAAASPDQLDRLAKLIQLTESGIRSLKHELKRVDHAQHRISQNCTALQFLIDSNSQENSACIITQEWVKRTQMLIEELLLKIIKNNEQIELLNDQLQQEQNKLTALQTQQRLLSGCDVSNKEMAQSAFGKSSIVRMQLR
jgi:hypothetical protein